MKSEGRVAKPQLDYRENPGFRKLLRFRSKNHLLQEKINSHYRIWCRGVAALVLEWVTEFLECSTSRVQEWTLASVVICTVQGSGSMGETRGGGCSSKNAFLPSERLPMHIVSPRPCQMPSWTLFISKVLDSCTILTKCKFHRIGTFGANFGNSYNIIYFYQMGTENLFLFFRDIVSVR